MRILLGLLPLGFIYCTPADLSTTRDLKDTSSDRIYVSLVEKGTVSTFYNRLASNDKQVVVTDAKVSGALNEVELTVVQGMRYCLVEPNNQNVRAYENEISNFGRIRLVAVSDLTTDIHEITADIKDYVECINPTNLENYASATEANPPAIFNGDSVADLRTNLDINIAPEWIREKLSQFSGAVPTIIDGEQRTISNRRTSGNKILARAWLRQEFEAIGYTVSEHSYGSGINFVAERLGADQDRFLAVTAHIDTVNTAGADDDGSGVIAGLAIATALKDAKLDYNLRIVGFDEEERGLIGSARYASMLKSEGLIDQLVGVINIEMTGYDRDKDGAIHVIDCNENTSADLTAIVMNVHSQDSLGLQKVAACTNRSDHAAFWRYNKPAIVISQNFFGGDSNPCYHRSCDTVERMDFDYASRITTLLARAVESVLVTN